MSSIPGEILAAVERPYELSEEQIAFYRANRFIKLKKVFDNTTLDYFADAINKKVSEINTVKSSLDQRDTYGKAFLQLFNLWRQDDIIRELVFSKRLARIATQLMGTEGVRLYHDQALFKEAGGGITPWHADQYYWPLDTDHTITAWLPLQATPLDMGPVEFCAGSHVIEEGRELEIGDQSETLIRQRLQVTDFPLVREPFEAGEISFHSGWVFHRAGANTSGQMRKTMTVIYMDRHTRLKQPGNKNQVADWETWCPGAVIGEEIDTPLNPVLY
ncbi:MAG: phytanoyl-CoA dioxygenase family protein [Chitinophagaceae bacterium]|nr:phytanoyl-CoA dioxygenase family protein [Chitinophagaceae bacterium]